MTRFPAINDREILSRFAWIIDRVALRFRYPLGILELSDVRSIGQLALLDSAHKYPSLSAEFIRYAKSRVRGAIIDEVRNATGVRSKYKRAAEHISTIEIADTGENPEDIAATRERARSVAASVVCLRPRLRVVATMLMGDNTQAEIAHKLNISEPRIDELRHKIRRDLGAPRAKKLPARDGQICNLFEAIDRYRSRLIRRALEMTSGNKTKAAILLGVNRTTLVELLKRHPVTLYKE